MRQLLRLLKDALAALGRWIGEIPYGRIASRIIKFIGDLLHRVLFTVLLPKRYRSLTKQQIYTIIFKSDTPAGKKFDIWLLVLIGINIITIMMESMAGTAAWFSWTMRTIGWLFTILFTFEYYLRIYCLNKPWRYVLSFYGIIDFLSIFPAWLSLLFPAVSTLSVLRLMRMLRIFRIFKMQKFLDEARFLMNSLKRSGVKILIFMMFVFIIAVILGATMYGIEGDRNEAISSIPRGVYWAVVTITTVGYGDIAPVTATGQFISTIVMLLGYSIIAVPTGIVAGETIEEHRRRHTHRKPSNHSRLEQHETIEEEDTDSPEQTAEKTIILREEDPAARVNEEDLL